MKIKRLIAFLLIIILLGFLAYFYPQVQSLATGKSISNANQDYQREPAVVTRVVDGDTIHVKINNKEEIIRMLGINNAIV